MSRPRVTAVFPEPTPYRTPLLDRLAARDDLELDVVYSARTVAQRSWEISLAHDATFLHGVRVPGVRRVLRHDYPLTFDIVPHLRRARPDAVVVSGWSTFAAQAAVVWCRAKRVPYVILSESHDVDPRSWWRRRVKRAVVPRIVAPAAALLAAGSVARSALERLGGGPERIWIFANTIDVDEFAARVDELRARRDELRGALGFRADDVVVASVARLAPEKALDTLLRAVAAMENDAAALFVGDGPMRAELDRLAASLDVRVHFTGDVPWQQVVEAYAVADVFALLSRHEPWGVAATEAAAAALPLVLSEHVGAAADLLVDGENGALVRVDDVAGTAAALDRYAADPRARAEAGAASRRIAGPWGYDASVEGFTAAVECALRGRRR